MHHDVKTAVKGELVSALLPPFQGEKKVRAGRIVALGIGPEPGTTRLALEGGAHVDVGKAWMQKHGAAAGHYYVQHVDDTTEALTAEVFEATFSLVEEDGTLVPTAAPEATVTLDGEQIAVKEIEGAFEKIVAKLRDTESQLHTATLERDGARARITQLEDELIAARQPGSPSAADLDKDAEEKKTAEATGGATQTGEGQS